MGQQTSRVLAVILAILAMKARNSSSTQLPKKLVPGKLDFGLRDLGWSVALGVISYIGIYVAMAIGFLLRLSPIVESTKIMLQAASGETINLPETVITERLEAGSWVLQVVTPAFVGFGCSWLISRFVRLRTSHLFLATVIFVLLRLILDRDLLHDCFRGWAGVVIYFLCGHGVVGVRPPRRLTASATAREAIE
jgi:hypothetical protein